MHHHRAARLHLWCYITSPGATRCELFVDASGKDAGFGGEVEDGVPSSMRYLPCICSRDRPVFTIRSMAPCTPHGSFENRG